MLINNAGYNHNHDADFYIDRPAGSGDSLLLLLKTETIMTIDGEDKLVPKNSFFLYQKGTPQYYRCLPQQTFSNDWVHFLFEGDEEAAFLERNIPYNQPIQMEQIAALSYCVKSIVHETYADNIYGKDSIQRYMFLMFNKVSEQLHQQQKKLPDGRFEMLSTIRNKIYRHPYEQRTIDSTAHEVRMSHSGFQHLYKTYFGVTFTQDLINSRIEYGKMLLSSTNLSISEIAVQCGYRHYEHFERQFRRKTGMTPQQYRLSCLGHL